jgi:hypothetical protein
MSSRALEQGLSRTPSRLLLPVIGSPFLLVRFVVFCQCEKKFFAAFMITYLRCSRPINLYELDCAGIRSLECGRESGSWSQW